MKNPIIGITLDEESKKTYSKYPWYASRKNYADSIILAGGTPIFLPNSIKKIPEYLNIIEGLVITGGDFDIDPKIYGEEILSEKVNLKPERTQFEFEITKYAIKKNIPMLGICGGQQLINVVFGGTLIQHIPDIVQSKINHEQINPRNQGSHNVKILENTRLKEIIKNSDMFVNSAHHQAVEKLGEGLIMNARADDGIIEGFENPELKFCIGIQWHPEFLIDDKDIEIFRSLVDSSK